MPGPQPLGVEFFTRHHGRAGQALMVDLVWAMALAGVADKAVSGIRLRCLSTALHLKMAGLP